jgi:hypothetical protein
MENSIQQITIKLVKEITEKAFSGQLSDLDSLAAQIFEDCTDAAKNILQEVIHIRNMELRNDKAFRKREGLVIKEKDRPREILTKLGVIKWERDYYYDRMDREYRFPLDHMLGIRKYERIGDEVGAELLNRAAEVSYAKSADIVTGGNVSRQSVRNLLLKANIPEKQPYEQDRSVSTLHIYADEDHVHMQKRGKKQGKQNRENPLVVVTEGTENIGSRRTRTVRPMYFVDEDQSSKHLWNSVEGYIEKAYKIEDLKEIYIHADGGQWIKNGLETFPRVIHVMDGYHFHKELRKLAKRHPDRNVRIVIENALKNNDRRKADSFLQELVEEDEESKRFGTYLFGHWEEIRNLLTLDIPGSCTEGQVSHILSERFSRDPMGWSREGLGKLSKLRVYRCNGEELTGKDMKPGEQRERYAEYADRYIAEAASGCPDWSIFDAPIYVTDENSGAQHMLEVLGRDYSVLGRNTLS